MLRTTEHANGQTIPLSGGARAVRPWGGLWSRERTHPGAPRPLSFRATPPRRGFSWENPSKSDCSANGSVPRLDPALSSSSIAAFSDPATCLLEGLDVNVTKFTGTVRPNVEREDVAVLHPVSIELNDLLGG